MVHRYVINRRTLLGPNDELVSASTTTWVSGVTLTSQWSNSNTFPTLNNPTNYPSPLIEKTVSNTVKFDQQINNKSLVIPIELKFEPMDNSDLIQDWVNSETQRAINSITDGEKVKYISVNRDLEIEFRFLNKDTNTYTNNYGGIGFDLPNEYKLNRFKQSYFRLYFYDSNSGETANLLFTEDVPVIQNTVAKFPLTRLYWDRGDVLMNNSYTNRVIYMNAKFFNAKTGQVQSFYNPPTTVDTPIDVNTYSDISNRGWRTNQITLINPNNSNGEFRFTTSNKITLSEFILS
jgi:hypothetical protein